MTLIKTFVLMLVGAGGVIGYDYYTEDAELRAQLEEEKARSEEYKTNLHRVLAERKSTRFRVHKKEPVEIDGKTTSKYLLKIAQWNEEEQRVYSQDVEIVGNKLYFEGVVVHYRQDEIVKGKGNLHLLHRIFSDIVPPSEGISLIESQLEAADALVTAEMPPVKLEPRKDTQEYIRRLVRDPEFARAEGVRTVNGQAIYDLRTLSEEFVYSIVEKSDGGYLIERDPIP